MLSLPPIEDVHTKAFTSSPPSMSAGVSVGVPTVLSTWLAWNEEAQQMRTAKIILLSLMPPCYFNFHPVKRLYRKKLSGQIVLPIYKEIIGF